MRVFNKAGSLLTRFVLKSARFARATFETVDSKKAGENRRDALPCDFIEFDEPVQLTEEQRTDITANCRDADCLGKVDGAGKILDLEDGRKIQIMFNGIRVIAGSYYGDWMQQLIKRCRGHHEPQEEVVFDRILEHIGPEAKMIELGGNWSFYSIWFLSSSAERQSIVLEPDPAYLRAGKENAELNNVRPTFFNAYVGETSMPPSPFLTESSGEVVIPCISVPELIETAGWKILDILHCDTQGAELDVIRSCIPLFQKNMIKWVVVSTHVHHISGDPLTHQRCLSLLKQLGANVVVEHDVHESFSGDGLIVAHFGALPPKWKSPSITYNRYSQSLFRNPLFDIALLNRLD